MIDKLESRLMDFPGVSNRARCFTHILNLVVKSIMYQFDVRTYDTDERYEPKLAGDIDDIDAEELELEGKQEDYCDDEPENPDNAEGWIDEQDGMEDKDIEELEDKIQPVRFLLMKVGESHLLCCIVLANLSTRLTLLTKVGKSLCSCTVLANLSTCPDLQTSICHQNLQYDCASTVVPDPRRPFT